VIAPSLPHNRLLTFARPPALQEPSKQVAPEDALSARLRSLRNGSLSPSPSSSPAPKSSHANAGPAEPTAALSEDPDPLHQHTDINDQTLDELLADLGPEDQWTLNPDDPKDIQKLLNEAKNALPRDEILPVKEAADKPGNDTRKVDKQYLTRDLDLSAFALDDGEESGNKSRESANLEEGSREAQDIVARLLDEVNLERQSEPKEEPDTPAAEEEPNNRGNSEGALSLPSAPSVLPELAPDTEPSRKSLDFESDIAARMAALKGLGSTNELGLPSAPTFKPADKPTKEVVKKFTDEEIDSWCIICQDDATVQCDGCDGDLYCANCWKEGHMGPEVGREERSHRWSKYRKPK